MTDPIQTSVKKTSEVTLRDEKKQNLIIEEVALDMPVAKPVNPIDGVRRVGAAKRHRPQRPLPIDRAMNALRRVPPGITALVFILVSGLPFGIFMLVARYNLRHQTIGPPESKATYFDLSRFLILGWASLLIIFAFAEGFARLASWVCGLSQKSTKYAPLAHTLCFRMTVLVWAGVTYQANRGLWENDTYQGENNWPETIKQIVMFLTISFAVLLVQGVALQLIAIHYVEGYVGPRARKGLKEIKTIRDLNDLVQKHIERDGPSYFIKILKKLFCPTQNDEYNAIVKGKGNEDAHREYAAKIWSAVTLDVHAEVLTLEDISLQLKAMGRDPEIAEDLFAQLDESCDGHVTREELENLVVKTGAQLNKRAKSMKGIRALLFKLEILLTLIVLVVIVFIYSNFFNQNWVKDTKALWTGMTGLGFALNTTVAEFVQSCVFVFSKHAYDVGDLVEAQTKKLVVRDIHLTHTNFCEIREGDDAEATGMVVQISHATLATGAIVNWTRSEDLKMLTQG